MPPKKKTPTASRKRPSAATSPQNPRNNNSNSNSNAKKNISNNSDINQHHHHRIRGNAADIASQEPCQVAAMFQTIEKKSSHGTTAERYLDPTCFPSYVEDDIWAILQECGFKYQGGFRCAEMDIFAQSFDHEDQVRQHLCLYGLPHSIQDVEEPEDAMLLQKWVAFAQVPIKESDAPESLEKLPLPSDYQALLWLGRLGFLIDGETKQIYRPRPLADGVDEFSSVEQVRAYVRSVGSDTLLANAENDDVYSPRKRARRTTRKDDMPLEEQEFVALRLWAALSPTPLPIYGETATTTAHNPSAASGRGGASASASASAKKNTMDIDNDDEEEEEIDDAKPQARASTTRAGRTPIATQNKDANSSDGEERPPSQASSGSVCIIL